MSIEAVRPLSNTSALAGVTFHFEVDGVDARWGVRSVSLREAVGELFHGMVEAREAHGAPEARALLGKRFNLSVARGEERRTVRGLIRQASAAELADGAHYTLHVVPSAWQLSIGCDTRTHLHSTVPDLVREVVQARLGGAVEVDTALLTQTYEVHEFLVQYQESDWAFLRRSMEQEGIFWFLTDDDDGERILLADGTAGLPLARPGHGGRVPHRGPMAFGLTESVFDLSHAEELGPTRATLCEYDWTNPSLEITAERANDSPLDPAPEVYDHTDAVSFHRYDGRQYAHHTAERAAQVRLEAIELMRQRWSMHSDVVTAMPGHVLHVEGAPVGDLDGSYMVVRAESGGTATEDESGNWANSLVAVPTSVAYRPSPSTPRPVVAGPETATVVGPAGQEVHTDQHGRVKVHFHWDRVRERTDPESSCWIRVSHNWAGPGFGTFFLPRIGMEVVVSFLGGNPDRPLVTGCLYNGDHPPPLNLPDEKTKSTIKTNSSLGGGGSNELRFEDKKGEEEVYIHAEKDFNEVVEHDHTTHVKNCQTNTVDVDQTETVGRDQTMTVKKDRTKTVDGTETSFIGGGSAPGHRLETVWGREEITINQTRDHIVKKDEALLVQEGTRTVTVDTGLNVETFKGGRETTVVKYDQLDVDGNMNAQITGQYNIKSGGHFKLLQNSANELTVSDSLYAAMVGRVQLKAGDGAVHYDAMRDGTGKIKASTKLVLSVGSSSIELTPSKITIVSPTVEIDGSIKVDVKGGTVDLKP